MHEIGASSMSWYIHIPQNMLNVETVKLVIINIYQIWCYKGPTGVIFVDIFPWTAIFQNQFKPIYIFRKNIIWICPHYWEGKYVYVSLKSLVGDDFRMIDPSRFGYPVSDVPSQPTPENQAKVFLNLLTQ